MKNIGDKEQAVSIFNIANNEEENEVNDNNNNNEREDIL